MKPNSLAVLKIILIIMNGVNILESEYINPIGNKINYADIGCLHLLGNEIGLDMNRLIENLLIINTDQIGKNVSQTVQSAIEHVNDGLIHTDIVLANVEETLQISGIALAEETKKRAILMNKAALAFICNLRNCCYPIKFGVKIESAHAHWTYACALDIHFIRFGEFRHYIFFVCFCEGKLFWDSEL